MPPLGLTVWALAHPCGKLIRRLGAGHHWQNEQEGHQDNPQKPIKLFSKSPMNASTRHWYEFGPFKLDAVERALIHEGEEVPLTPKCIETLLVLVENRGRLLKKDELMERIWPDTVVEEANLTQTISVLRKTLGDNHQSPQFIVTVHGRGYRFIADVREIYDTPDAPVVEDHTRQSIIISQTNPKAGKPSWRRWRFSQLLMMTALIVTLVVAVGVWSAARWRKSLSAGEPMRPRSLLTLKGGAGRFVSEGRFSPDGRMVVFATPGDEGDIWIMQASGESRRIQITKDEWRDWSPLWSPDGNYIAFVSTRGKRIGIWRIPFLGGAAELLKSLGDVTLDVRGGPPLLKAWAKDGAAIYYEWNRNLFELRLSSQTIRQVTQFNPSQRTTRHFAVSPDEKWLVYAEGHGEKSSIWRISMAGGEPQRVTSADLTDLHPIWHPDGERLVFSSLRDGRMEICMTDVSGGVPITLTPGQHVGRVSDITPDGKLLCQSLRDESDLYVLDSESGVEKQFTEDWGVEFWPSVAPLGELIAFQAVTGDHFSWDPRKASLLLKSSVSFGADEPPRKIAEDGFSVQWSPDGAKLAFLRWDGDLYNLWIAPSLGGEPKQLTDDGVVYAGQTVGPTFNRLQVADYSWSPDGGQIAYCSKKDGAINVWTVTADGSREIRLSENRDTALRINCPLWSPDGRRIAYVTSANPALTDKQDWGLWVRDQTKAVMVFQTDAVLRLLGWAEDGDLIAALTVNDDRSRALPADVWLIRVSATSFSARTLSRFQHAYHASFQLSPDRRNVSFVATHEGRDDIWLFATANGQSRRVTGNEDEKVFYSSLAWAPDGKSLYFGKQTRLSLLSIINLPN